MSILNKSKKQNQREKSHQLLIGAQHDRILNDSIELIQTTVYPDTFFSRYALALKEAKLIIEQSPDTSYGEYASEVLAILTEDKEEIIMDFFERWYFLGKLSHVKDDIISHKDEIPPQSYEYFFSLLAL